MDYIINNNIISPRQAAYLKGDSTTNQLVYLVHTIQKAWAENKNPHLVFLDQSAAFDKVWHKGLCTRLEQINIKGSALDLFKSYLSNRKQVTVIEDAMSDIASLEAGVPQGSKLGPLLYLIYTETISNGLKCEYLQFADDTILLAIDEDPNLTAKKLNHDLITITHWATKWKVKFNPDKSNDMIFSQKSLNNSPPVVFNGLNINRVSRHRHLGLHLTADLSWDWHIAEISRKVNHKLHILRSVKMLCRRTLENMYKMYIRSYFDYASPAFSSSLYIYQNEKLEKLQYNAARIVTGAYPSTSRVKLLKELGWESIAERLKQLRMILFQKIHNGSTRPLIRSCLPNIADTNKDTRTKFYYAPYKINTTRFNRTFFPDTIKLWNKLPSKYYNIEDLRIYLKTTYNPPKRRFNNIGSKIGNMFHMQLRVNRNNLNQSRWEISLEESPKCDFCGEKREDIKHFVLKCNKYNREREKLMLEIQPLFGKQFDRFSQPKILDILLFGLPNIDNDHSIWLNNKQIASSFQRFILSTNRLGYQKKKNSYNEEF